MIFPRFSSAENRLLHVTLEDMGGVKYNRRNAEINAANQTATHQQALATNLKTDIMAAPSANNTRLALSPSGQTMLAGANATQTPLNQQGFQTYDATTGKTTLAPQLGALDESALKRLMEGNPAKGIAGMTEGQARDRITSLRPSIAQDMASTGLDIGTQRRQGLLTPQKAAEYDAGQSNDEISAAMERATTETAQAGGDKSLQESNAKIAALETQKRQRDQKAIADAAKLKKKEGEKPMEDPAIAGLRAALSGLSPDERAIIEPILNNMESEFSAAQTDSETRTKVMLEGGEMNGVEIEGINSQFKKLEDKIDKAEQARTFLFDKVDKMNEESRARTEDLITQQQQAANERLTWNQHQQEVDLARQKTQNHQSLIAQYALGGGFGQDAAALQVRESDASFDQKLRDVQSEFGVQRTELSAKFTGLYVQNENSYREASIKNQQETLSALERLGIQGNQNTMAFMNAQNNILDKAGEREASLKAAQAKGIQDIAGQMLGLMNQKRDDERADEARGWTLFNQAFDNYKGKIPQSILNEVKRLIPTFDVNNLSASRGSGVGGASFSGANLDAAGLPPSLEDYMNQKMQQKSGLLDDDFHSTGKSGPVAGEASADEKRVWKKEWQSKIDAYNYLLPSAIQRDFDGKIGSNVVPGNKLPTIKKQFDGYMAKKMYAEARNLTDGIGTELSDGALKPILTMSNIRSNLKEMRFLLQSVKDRIGPIQGPFWSYISDNIASDPDFARLQAIRDITLSPVARGVASEVGTLTDADALRSLRSLVLEDRSYEANIAVLDQTESLLTAAMTNTMNTYKTSGRKVDKITPYIFGESQPIANPNDEVIDSIIDSVINLPQ